MPVNQNEVFLDGDFLSLPVPADTKKGAAVIVGSLIGVTQTNEGEGGNADGFATVMRKGAHNLSVTGAIASVGLPVFIPAAGGALTTTVGTNVLYGYALATKSSGTGVVLVLLARV